MKKRLVISTLLILILYSTDAQQSLDISGYARNYTGVLTADPNNLAQLENTLNLVFQAKNENSGFKVKPYLYQYFEGGIKFGLREAYIDLFLKNLDIRVGKQQIIWGKADGVFITDIVSPKDLSEFLLPEFEEIRQGVTSLKLNFYKGDNQFEIVFVPGFSPTKLPDYSSIWYPAITFPITPVYDNSTSVKEMNLANTELFGRYSFISSHIDFEVVAGHFYYDDPTMHLQKTIDPATMQLTNLVVRPDYHKVNMLGGSFNIPIKEIVFRGEAAYYNGRFFQSSNPIHTDATIEKNNLHYLVGIDYTFKGIKLSSQFIQEYILDYETGMVNEEFENTMTVLAKKDFFREKLWVEVFSYIGLNDQDALVRPKITYSFSDGIELQLGANLFYGDSGKFGQYDKNDMIFTKIKYSF